MLSPLATTADGVTFGYTGLTTSNLQRASTRIRGALHQDVSRRSSTVTGMGPSITLPQTPINSITSVKDAAGGNVYFRQYGQLISTGRYIPLTIVYDHGLDTLSDEMVELVCAIAWRIQSAPSELSQGVQSQGTGPLTITYGMDAVNGQSGLTKGEEKVLRRIWPRMPRSYEMGATAEVYPVGDTTNFGEHL